MAPERGSGRVARERGPALLLDKLECGQVLLGTSPVVEISLSLALEDAMRLTFDVDDESLTLAAALTGIEDRAVVIQHALELLVRIASGRQLNTLAGTDGNAVAAPRRRGYCPRCEPDGIRRRCALESIGLLWEQEDIDVCCNNRSDSPG